MRRLTLDDVTSARDVLGPHLPATPLRPCQALEGRTWLKLECWQPTGSFKVRGALNALSAMSTAERAAGLVTASAGNHGLGVAFAAQTLGLEDEVSVFVPRTAPQAKLRRLRRFPVTVVEHGETYEEASAAAHEHARHRGSRFVHAYEDPVIAAGQGTIALELLEQLPELTRVFVPVGGGGLIAGLATAFAALRPTVRVVAVQPAASPALRASLERGIALTEYPAGPTLADGVAGGIGEIAFEHRDLIHDVVVVEEEQLENAMLALLEHDQVVAEGSGALGVAALMADSGGQKHTGASVVVVTGGNVDLAVIRRLLTTRG